MLQVNGCQMDCYVYVLGGYRITYNLKEAGSTMYGRATTSGERMFC